jgi:hypothetical protein
MESFYSFFMLALVFKSQILFLSPQVRILVTTGSPVAAPRRCYPSTPLMCLAGLAYCSSTRAVSFMTIYLCTEGGQPMWPIPLKAMDPAPGETKKEKGGRETLPGGPQGGKILLENDRRLWSFSKGPKLS